MIGQAVAVAAMAAQLLLGSLGCVQADSDPRFYALPGIGVGPFWIGEPMELASLELWRLTGFAHDEQGRPAVFVDSDGNLCSMKPHWCISEDDGVAKTLGYLAWVWTSDPPRVALVATVTPHEPWGGSRVDFDLRPMGLSTSVERPMKGDQALPSPYSRSS